MTEACAGICRKQGGRNAGRATADASAWRQAVGDHSPAGVRRCCIQQGPARTYCQLTPRLTWQAGKAIVNESWSICKTLTCQCCMHALVYLLA